MRRILILFFAVVLCAGLLFLRPCNLPSPIGGGTAVGILGNMWSVKAGEQWPGGTRQLLSGTDALLRFGQDGALTLFSQEDLSVLAQNELEVSGSAFAQLLDEGISIADPERGTVTFLNEALEITGVYTPLCGGDMWLMGLDGQTLYGFSREGVTALELESGSLRTVLEPGLSLELSSRTAHSMTLIRVGEDLRECRYQLSMETGALTELEDSAVIADAIGLIPMTDGRYFYCDGRNFSVYEPDGTLRTYCVFSGQGDSPGTAEPLEPVWSERWQGYFFVDRGGEAEQLIFLDPARNVGGEGVVLAEETAPEGEVLPRELYDRAEALGDRFGVDLRIADQCQLDYGTFRSRSFAEPKRVSDALELLEQALERYPAGYLEQLRYGGIRRIRIELVSALKPDSDADVSSTAAAFSRERTREYLIVLDGDVLKETNLHHELAHVLGKRMDFDAALRENALYREEDWMALQPEGFAYADSYREISEDVTAFYDSGCFARDYACVSASEDQATMMETAIMGREDIYGRNPGLMPKLQYYCACIRDSFDTEGWPEKTVWEQLLE